MNRDPQTFLARRAAAPSVIAAALSGPPLPSAALAELMPQWIARVPVGSSITAGFYGMATDAAGSCFLAGSSGISSNRDITTVRLAPGGGVLWSAVYDGPMQWHEGVAGVALGPDGSVYVAGSTPGPGFYANLLLLRYDGDTGALVWQRQFDGGPFVSDGATCLTTDPAGNVYVGGSTVGDGSDCLTIRFDPDGNVVWSRTWDGPAAAPYSHEAVRGIAVAPDGNVVIIIDGVMSSLHPDCVTIKYAAPDGATLWQSTFGSNGGDTPVDLAIDAAGDVYVTGTSINLNDMYATIKIRGTDGLLLWARYDSNGIDDGARAVALDGAGGVYVTGAIDPDGNESNFNDNIYTVKRDATSGALLWSHLYGLDCIGCFDVPADVIVDPAGNVLVAGTTNSPPYSADTILLVLDSSTGPETERGIVSGNDTERADPRTLRLDGSGNISIGGEFADFNTGAVDMSVVRYASLAGIPGDLDGDGAVGMTDLLSLLSQWGPCSSPPAECPADLDGDGAAGVVDLLELLAGWS